jgi:hypothetical protein
METVKSLYERLQNLTGRTRYIAWALAGLMVGIVLDFFPGPPFGAFWLPPVFGLVWGVTAAFQAEGNRKHPKQPPPLGPPTRRSPF